MFLETSRSPKDWTPPDFSPSSLSLLPLLLIPSILYHPHLPKFSKFPSCVLHEVTMTMLISRSDVVFPKIVEVGQRQLVFPLLDDLSPTWGTHIQHVSQNNGRGSKDCERIPSVPHYVTEEEGLVETWRGGAGRRIQMM